MVEKFYEYFNTIDVHDHLRQGSLAMEESWATKYWRHRLFTTILGMIFTNNFLIYKYLELQKTNNDDSNADDLFTFT